MIRVTTLSALMGLTWLYSSQACQAGFIPSGYTIADAGKFVGFDPRFSADGGILENPSSVGEYSFGNTLSTNPQTPNQYVEVYLHRLGSDKNLLPYPLNKPTTSLRDLDASGNVLLSTPSENGVNFRPAIFSVSDGKITYPTADNPLSLQLIGMNSLGQLVGYDPKGILLMDSPTSKPIYLESLLPVNTGWRALTVYDIDNNGRLVGTGVNPAGQQANFFLTPVPEPSTFLLFSIAIAMVGLRFHTRNS